MTEDTALNDVMETIRKWTDEKPSSSPSLLISVENGSFHVGYYTGMGTSDSASIDKFSPLHRTTIEQLYRQGQLEVVGRAFTLYPGSDRFRKLLFKKQDSQSK